MRVFGLFIESQQNNCLYPIPNLDNPDNLHYLPLRRNRRLSWSRQMLANRVVDRC